MLIIEYHDSKAAAERSRKFFVRAQKQVDKVFVRLYHELPIPSPEDSYKVIRKDDRYAVAVDDPSV